MERSDFWYWKGQLSKDYCQNIIKEVKDNKFTPGTILGDVQGNKKIRDNTVFWLPRMHNLECVLAHHAREANVSMGWNVELTHNLDQVQVSKYEKKQHYTYHNDLMFFKDSNLERKMSVILFLSNENDFEGGKLELGNQVLDTREQGTIVAFPSFLHHRIQPITKGTRYSATLWIAGPRFR